MLAPVDVAHFEEARAASMLAASAQESRPWAGGTMAFSGRGSWQNQVMGAGLDQPVSDAQIDEMVAFYESRGVEARIELCPFAHESLTSGLSDRLFTVRELENVLAFDLRGVLPKLPHGWPAGVEIELVDPDDSTGIEALVEVSLRGFVPVGTPIPGALRDASRRVLSMARTRGFVARLEDQVVGGGLLDLTEDSANLAGTSVIPEARRRGIQQALVRARLQTAREHGCRIATIDSKPGIPTERNAMRLGFAMAYTKIVLARAGAGLQPSP
jgi:GNAT superfamily N-acetyltransferase